MILKITISLMKEIKFINSYSFIYSPRPGTPASELKEVNLKISKARLSTFQKIADEIKKDYRSSLLGQELEVLFENKIKNESSYFGRDKYLNSVIAQSDNNLTGQIRKIKIDKFNYNTLFGKVVVLEKNNKKSVAA